MGAPIKELIVFRFIPCVMLFSGACYGQANAESHESLVKELRTRHMNFMRREIVVEKFWSDHVNPETEIMQRRFNESKFGGRKLRQSDAAESLPKPYRQPHRVHIQLLTQGNETTLKYGKELEKIINPKFGWKISEGLIWSNVGGQNREYHPPPHNTLHLRPTEPNSLLYLKRDSIESALGYGCLRSIKSITEVRRTGERMLCKGVMVQYGTDSKFELEMDNDQIIRRLEIVTPSKPGRTRYIAETTGTIRPKRVPSIAREGRFRRVIEVGDKKWTEDDDQYRFVKISGRLSRDGYLRHVRINVPKNAQKIDERPEKGK